MALNPRTLAHLAPLVAAGTELAASVVGGVIAGYYLDRYLGSAPWLTLLFTLAGLAGGLSRLLWALRRLERNRDKQDESESPQRG
ncbi:MAG: AtpZ/AtpI family protein [Candidatus Binatia bacterium]|nr:AtpZ/AtpI family protein [Candidatus Binatia bacterium]